MRYEHCIFDLYGTLVDIRTDEDKPELWQCLAVKLKLTKGSDSPEQLKKEYQRLVQAELEAVEASGRGLPEIDLRPVFEKLLKLPRCSKRRVSPEELAYDFRKMSTEKIGLYPGVAEMLEALKTSGRKIWLLSNAQRLFTEPELRRLGIYSYFDGIYLSSDHGIRKPDPEFFRVLLREQNIDPERAVMVGNDGSCDIRGGTDCGTCNAVCPF